MVAGAAEADDVLVEKGTKETGSRGSPGSFGPAAAVVAAEAAAAAAGIAEEAEAGAGFGAEAEAGSGAAAGSEEAAVSPGFGYSSGSLRQGTQSRNSRKPGGAFISAEAHRAAAATACQEGGGRRFRNGEGMFA